MTSRDQSQVQDLPGHNGGVTGIQIQLNLVATSSYDSTVSVTDCLVSMNIRRDCNCAGTTVGHRPRGMCPHTSQL